MFPFADLVPLRAGRPLRSPGPGEGSEGAAEAQPAAPQTVSGTSNAPRHDHLSGRDIDRRDLSSIWSAGVCREKFERDLWAARKMRLPPPRETELPFLLATLVNESIQRAESNCSVPALLCTRQKCQRAPSVEGFLKELKSKCKKFEGI